MTMDRESGSKTPKIAATQLLRPLQRGHLDRNLITEFFFVFSRFEYALKRTKFLKSDRDHAETDWDAFAAKIKQHYDPNETPELARAVSYLLSSPPKRQIVEEDKSLGWEKDKGGNDTSIHRVLVLVRRARNNLFHGGKYPLEPLPEPARDTQLLESSMIVLTACLGWHEEVRRRYMSDFDE
jgi:hypothetical protein